MNSINSKNIWILFGCFLLSGNLFALDEVDIGSGVKIISPIQEFNLSISSNGKLSGRGIAPPVFSGFDIDNDGVTDNVFVISYDSSSRFKKNVIKVSLFEKHTLFISKESFLFVKKNIKAIEFFDQNPKNETYALAVQLSSKIKKIYILTQPGFFPETNKHNLSFSVHIANKYSNEYSLYANLLNENSINPTSIIGAIVEISGCIPEEDSCEGPIIGAYWNGRVFKSIWAGVMWN